MGFRFFRRMKILPGVTLNASKSGLSVSLGPRGAKYTIGPRGERVTIGLPGTGLSYTVTSSNKSKGSYASDSNEIKEIKRSIVQSGAELRSIIDKLDDDTNDHSFNDSIEYKEVKRLNFLQKMMYPKHVVGFIDAFADINDNDYVSALESCLKATSTADGNLLAAFICVQLDKIDDVAFYLSEALKNDNQLGELQNKLNFPFVAHLPITSGLKFPVIGLNKETALLLSAIISESKNDYKEALKSAKLAYNTSNHKDILKIYLVKLSSKLFPNAEDTRADIRWLQNSFNNAINENTQLKEALLEILNEYYCILNKVATTQYTSPIKDINSNLEKSFIYNLMKSKYSSIKSYDLLLGYDNDLPKFVSLSQIYNTIIIGDSGVGKSSVIHGMIQGLIAQHIPSELKFFIADSNGIELSVYKNLPHVRNFIASNTDDLNIVLSSLLYETNNRISIFNSVQVKSIDAYNLKQSQEDLLHRIVLVIDNISDFISRYYNAEPLISNICKIIELSRISGIHIVMCAYPDISSHIDINFFKCKLLLNGVFNNSEYIDIINTDLVTEPKKYHMFASVPDLNLASELRVIESTDDDIEHLTSYWASRDRKRQLDETCSRKSI